MTGDEIIGSYTKEEDIQKIIDSIKSKPIEKTKHFYNSAIYGRDVDEEFIDETFHKFNLVRLINKRRHEKGDIGYDFYYEISKSRTLIICLIPLKDKILMINAIDRKRKWQDSIISSSNKRF